MSRYATVAINIYLASNLKMIHKKAHKVCKILRLQFRLQYARWYGLYKNAMGNTDRRTELHNSYIMMPLGRHFTKIFLAWFG